MAYLYALPQFWSILTSQTLMITLRNSRKKITPSSCKKTKILATFWQDFQSRMPMMRPTRVHSLLTFVTEMKTTLSALISRTVPCELQPDSITRSGIGTICKFELLTMDLPLCSVTSWSKLTSSKNHNIHQ